MAKELDEADPSTCLWWRPAAARARGCRQRPRPAWRSGAPGQAARGADVSLVQARQWVRGRALAGARAGIMLHEPVHRLSGACLGCAIFRQAPVASHEPEGCRLVEERVSTNLHSAIPLPLRRLLALRHLQAKAVTPCAVEMSSQALQVPAMIARSPVAIKVLCTAACRDLGLGRRMGWCAYRRC